MIEEEEEEKEEREMIPAGHLVVPVGLMTVNPVTFTGRCCNCCCTLPLSLSLLPF